jgi:hypothetical protein
MLHAITIMSSNISCFSAENFEKACLYLVTLPKQYTETGGVDVQLVNADGNNRIAFKREGYSIGFISRQTGVVALAKHGQDNERNIKVIEQAFCMLMDSANKSENEK